MLAEDRLVEWMQFLCFTVISVMLGLVAVERARHVSPLSLEVLGIAGLSLLVGLAALEEISWFQRVLGVESSEFFRQNNRQAETNLHNLALGSGSLHKTVILKLILITGLAHNLVLPLLARSRPAIKRYVESVGLYLPPLPVSIIYLVLVILSHVLIDHPRKGELGEMFGAVHYLATVFAAYMVGIGYDRPKMFDSESDCRRLVVIFQVVMVFILFLSWLLAAGTVPNMAA
ncbi:hypothetical protein HF313_17725 [Massilia atriviolacea]|uniref:Uncharacterized protein n=1 Tax=Massilia atriviolacea TaxID=2495579 RepID=A0A430HUA4_9BURK|nr:hypothetical protein EJB06_01670 [Massilia atriviolacea]